MKRTTTSNDHFLSLWKAFKRGSSIFASEIRSVLNPTATRRRLKAKNVERKIRYLNQQTRLENARSNLKRVRSSTVRSNLAKDMTERIVGKR